METINLPIEEELVLSNHDPSEHVHLQKSLVEGGYMGFQLPERKIYDLNKRIPLFRTDKDNHRTLLAHVKISEYSHTKDKNGTLITRGHYRVVGVVKNV